MPTDTASETDTATLTITAPDMADGALMWGLARDSALDLNSSYAYLIFARDFARTSRIAKSGEEPAGFVMGYERPDEPGTLVVWQVAVADAWRGHRLASRMLTSLMTATGCRFIEATITADNAASHRLFRGLVRNHSVARVEQHPMLTAHHFPDDHEAEDLVRVGPFDPAGS